jgi:hypothetical protein
MGSILGGLGGVVGGAIARVPLRRIIFEYQDTLPLTCLGIMLFAFIWALHAMLRRRPPLRVTAPDPGTSPLFDRELDGGP